MQITGAFLLVACWVTGVGADEVHWKCDRYVSLAEPARLAPSDVQWSSTLVHLQPHAELRLRNSTARVGGILNRHFGDYAALRWHAWPTASNSTLRTHLATADGPFTFASAKVFPRVVGIVPVIERCRF